MNGSLSFVVRWSVSRFGSGSPNSPKCRHRCVRHRMLLLRLVLLLHPDQMVFLPRISLLSYRVCSFHGFIYFLLDPCASSNLVLRSYGFRGRYRRYCGLIPTPNVGLSRRSQRLLTGRLSKQRFMVDVNGIVQATSFTPSRTQPTNS